MAEITELIVDVYGCRANLSDANFLERAAREAVTSVGARVATSTHYPFQPHGLTLCLVLMESHFVISTWPEHEFAIVNIFLCNPEMSARKVWDAFLPALDPKNPNDVVFHYVNHHIGPARRPAFLDEPAASSAFEPASFSAPS